LKKVLSGKFVVLDGPDGCGKTTHTKLLVKWLQEQGIAVDTFRDPGATPIGEKIRELLLDRGHIGMSTGTELLLYMAAKTQLWQEKIAPAIRGGKCVILDRWLSSTCAYQGYAGGLGMDKVVKVANDCLEKPWPDLTIILDVDLKTASKRLNKELDRMEAKGDGYHHKVREGFLQLASKQKNFVVVDAAGDVETVRKKVIEAVQKNF